MMARRGIKKRGFKIGDRVVIVRSPVPERIGQIATIMSELVPLRPHPTSTWVGRVPFDTPSHILDLPPLPGTKGKDVRYPPEYLELYRNDGDDKVSWEDLPAWVPRPVNT